MSQVPDAVASAAAAPRSPQPSDFNLMWVYCPGFWLEWIFERLTSGYWSCFTHPGWEQEVSVGLHFSLLPPPPSSSGPGIQDIGVWKPAPAPGVGANSGCNLGFRESWASGCSQHLSRSVPLALFHFPCCFFLEYFLINRLPLNSHPGVCF